MRWYTLLLIGILGTTSLQAKANVRLIGVDQTVNDSRTGRSITTDLGDATSVERQSKSGGRLYVVVRGYNPELARLGHLAEFAPLIDCMGSRQRANILEENAVDRFFFDCFN